VIAGKERGERTKNADRGFERIRAREKKKGKFFCHENRNVRIFARILGS